MSTIKNNISISPEKAEDFVWDPAKENKMALRWLGQAGFEIFYKNYHLMIDPYLSDYLAKKYAGKEFPHTRVMPPPVAVSEIRDLDFILCTHRHSDHMDPEAIQILLDNNPGCKIVAPKAEREHVLNNLEVNEKKAIFANPDRTIKLNDGIEIEAIPSAHEELKRDQDGNHYYLGYILSFDNIVLYHSGDCVPYEDLPAELSVRNINIAMLPVNGRDEFRSSRGVPGNFTFEEAIELCKNASISNMICHHFGMFDFNTLDEKWLRENADKVSNSCFTCFVPDMEHYMIW
jgi:L-ascorbate metabolism protein UlaG (beta-lactamase superfamily)